MGEHRIVGTRARKKRSGAPLPFEFNKKSADALIRFAKTIPDWQYNQNSIEWIENAPRCCFAAHYGRTKQLLVPLTRNIILYFSAMLCITELESRYIFSIRRVIKESAEKLGLKHPKDFGRQGLIDRINIIRDRHTR